MRYYTRIQRESEGYAARVFEDLFPAVSERRAAATLLRAVIQRAAAATTAWSITLDPDSVRVNVGPVQLFSLSQDRAWLCVAGTKLPKLPRGIRDVSRGAMVYPTSVPIASRQYLVKARNLSALPDKVHGAALAYVDAAGARRRGRPLWEKSHSPGVLYFLEGFLQTASPRSALPDYEPHECALEGAPRLFFHFRRERDRRLVEAKLNQVRAVLGRIQCEACGFTVDDTYPELGCEICEVHHRRPLSEAAAPTNTTLDDLAVLCPNCHRAIHRTEPLLSVEDFRARFFQSNGAG